MVKQAHGGALRVGNPGNKGGGRPLDRVRETALLAYEERIPILSAIADGEVVERAQLQGVDGKLIEAKVSAKVRDRIRAIESLGRMGSGGDSESSGDVEVHIHLDM